ncbi:MAG: hypothetical protein RTU92_06860 [Candidatus Thorarchaeota archaeon]
MSGKSKVQTPSTVEAIRMASASILGTTTKQGYPLGSAIGSGSMMEQNSESVAMNVTPLVFSIKESLRESEGLELLSIEWDLDRVPSPEVLPEQLVVAGSSAKGVDAHVSVLSWERGVVDPFKIDAHIQTLARKIQSIEAAVINNNLNYDEEGFQVLRRFNDRFNSVIFVEMIDRQFQGSWDSFQLKPEQVDEELVLRLGIRDDFTVMPPGPKIVKVNDVQFESPRGSEEDLLTHFQHRILTPAGIETIAIMITEAGRAILSELNTFAYSIEEVDVARVTINGLKEFLGRDRVELSDIESIRDQANSFAIILSETVQSYEEILETHISSGKTLSLDNHKRELYDQLERDPDAFDGLKMNLAKEFVDMAVVALEREFTAIGEIRAWQLKSVLRYFIAYAKRVSEYFVRELNQYLIVTSARKSFVSALQEFRKSTESQELDPTDLLLFDKFYSELYNQLNAIFDKKEYEGSKQNSSDELNKLIASEMIDVFKRIDMWDLVDFGDVAQIAHDEISKRYRSEEGLDQTGAALTEILDSLVRLVFEIVPELSTTLLSKQVIESLIDQTSGESANVIDILMRIIDELEKSDDWKGEARSWIDEFGSEFNFESALSNILLEFLRFIHSKAGKGLTARTVVDRVDEITKQLQTVYDSKVDAWKGVCDEIEKQNQVIREYNEKRQTLLKQTEQEFQADYARYEAAMAEYRSKMTAREVKVKADAEAAAIATAEGLEYVPPPLEAIPVEPQSPMPLEQLIEKVKIEYPEKQEQPMPSKPEPDDSLKQHSELHSLLTEKLTRMDETQENMENTFAEHLKKLQAGETSSSEVVEVDLDEDLLQYLMSSMMRGLSRVLPRVKRVYLRKPEIPKLIYLVTYEHIGDELIIKVGGNLLR